MRSSFLRIHLGVPRAFWSISPPFEIPLTDIFITQESASLSEMHLKMMRWVWWYIHILYTIWKCSKESSSIVCSNFILPDGDTLENFYTIFRQPRTYSFIHTKISLKIVEFILFSIILNNFQIFFVKYV